MVESRVEAWDRMERENAELRRALEPFARVAVTPLRFAVVRYGTDTDPERQTFQTPSMHRAFNRAAEVLRAHRDGVKGAPGVTGTLAPGQEHRDLMLLAASDLESWMKSYHRDAATEDLVKRLRDAAAGVIASQAPEYFCNKCGYFGPAVEFPHQRPNGVGECGYMAVPMKAAAGVKEVGK